MALALARAAAAATRTAGGAPALLLVLPVMMIALAVMVVLVMLAKVGCHHGSGRSCGVRPLPPPCVSRDEGVCGLDISHQGCSKRIQLARIVHIDALPSSCCSAPCACSFAEGSHGSRVSTAAAAETSARAAAAGTSRVAASAAAGSVAARTASRSRPAPSSAARAASRAACERASRWRGARARACSGHQRSGRMRGRRDAARLNIPLASHRHGSCVRHSRRHALRVSSLKGDGHLVHLPGGEWLQTQRARRQLPHERRQLRHLVLGDGQLSLPPRKGDARAHGSCSGAARRLGCSDAGVALRARLGLQGSQLPPQRLHLGWVQNHGAGRDHAAVHMSVPAVPTNTALVSMPAQCQCWHGESKLLMMMTVSCRAVRAARRALCAPSRYTSVQHGGRVG